MIDIWIRVNEPVTIEKRQCTQQISNKFLEDRWSFIRAYLPQYPKYQRGVAVGCDYGIRRTDTIVEAKLNQKKKVRVV